MVGYQFLSQLKQREHSQKVRVRVARMWDAIIPGPEKKFLSLELLVVDEQGDAMQASIKKTDVHFFKSKIKEGYSYEIADFFIGDKKRSFNATSSQNIMNFVRNTKVVELPDGSNCLPMHYFEFRSFGSLLEHKDDNSMLTDFIGILKRIGNITQGHGKIRSDILEMQTIILQDENANTVNVTLWAEKASFLKPDRLLGRMNSVVVLAGMCVRGFQGDATLYTSSASKIYLDLPIIESQYLKKKYEAQPLVVQMLELENQPHHLINDNVNENRKTIDELMKIDLMKSKDLFFTCKAKIVDIDSSDGWYYTSCDKCPKSLRFVDGKLRCSNNDHEEPNPKLTYKLSMVVKDGTGESEFVAFGHIAEKLIGKSIPNLAAEELLDKNVLLVVIKNLIKQERIFKVNLTKQAVEIGVPAFAVNKTFFVDEEQATPSIGAGSSSGVATELEVPIHANVDGQQPTTQSTITIPSDLFPIESPAKKQPLSHEHGSSVLS